MLYRLLKAALLKLESKSHLLIFFQKRACQNRFIDYPITHTYYA